MSQRLPETAYRKLEAGEVYTPVLLPEKTCKEVTFYSVSLGIFFMIIFTFTLMYLALKLGLGISADTPVAIIGVGLAFMLKKAEPLGENIIMQYIPYTASAVMVTGTFIMPAFIILGMKISYIDCLITIILGGILGTLVSTVYRKYFVEEMHGVYPFPGSFATAEILITSEGKSTKIMAISGIIGFIYDFITGSVGWWNEVFTTRAFAWGESFAEKYKFLFKIDVSAAFLGVGFLTGIRYSSIIAAGAIFSGFICIPLLGLVIETGNISFIPNSPEHIYTYYVKAIGVGALAAAGIISLFKMMKVISKALGKAVKDIFGSSKLLQEEKSATVRTDLDLNAKTVLIGSILTLILMGIFFYFRTTNQSITISVISVFIALVFSLLFSIIAATAIAYTNNEPVSGMTILMMIVSALIFGAINVRGEFAAYLILALAATVIAMLGQSGYVAGAYKTGYLLGATPKKLEIWGIISVIISAPIIILAFVILNKAYGFTGASALAAPQGNAMASILKPVIFSGSSVPWIFYVIGIFVAIAISMCGIEALPFAMGMYLPMQLAMPFLAGGILSWIVSTRNHDSKVNFDRKQRGTIVSAGLIAGGAIAGIISAVLQIFKINFCNTAWLKNPDSEIVSLVALVALSVFVVAYSMKVNKKR